MRKADLVVCGLNGMEDLLVSNPISSRPVCSWQQGWMFKESQTQRPGGTIRVTSLNSCKPDYEAFLPSTFCTEPVEYGEGDQGHSCGKQVGWQGQCVDCGFFLRLEVKALIISSKEGNRISLRSNVQTILPPEPFVLLRGELWVPAQTSVGTESSPLTSSFLPVAAAKSIPGPTQLHHPGPVSVPPPAADPAPPKKMSIFDKDSCRQVLQLLMLSLN